jgi:hypothetical protein
LPYRRPQLERFVAVASIKLYEDELDRGQLPNVCMKCGAPADTQVRKTFSWCPGWVLVLIFVALLPWLIVTLVLTKRRSVYVPLCNQHKNHWRVRSLITLGGLALLGILGVGTIFVFMSEAERRDTFATNLGGYFCVGTILFLLAFIIVAAIMQSSTIRPSEITDRRITLTGVSQDFKDALRDQDAGYPDVAEGYGERFEERQRRPKSEEFYDREGRRIQRKQEDDDE